MTWLLTIVSLIGNYLNCRKVRVCFVIWLICNVGWLVYDIANAIYARAILDIVQSAFCVYGYYEWGENNG